MKIREGFVSNSSTTSFTCDACGNVIAYNDNCSLEDYGVITFTPCNHGVCECNHPDMDDEEIQKKWKAGALAAVKEELELEYAEKQEPNRWNSKENIQNRCDAFKNILEGNFEDFEEFRKAVNDFEYDWRNFMPSTVCPVCTLESLGYDYIIQYVIVKYGLKLGEVENEIKEKFGTFDKFSKWLKEQK